MVLIVRTLTPLHGYIRFIGKHSDNLNIIHVFCQELTQLLLPLLCAYDPEFHGNYVDSGW